MSEKKYDLNLSQRILEVHNINDVTNECDVVYTTRWRSMGEDKKDENWQKHCIRIKDRLLT